jgi:hypothetical protein
MIDLYKAVFRYFIFPVLLFAFCYGMVWVLVSVAPNI